jgi:putative phage-type endonuclease
MSASTDLPAPVHERRKFIGGSDIAAILGISPWKTPYQLWLDKTTPPSTAPDDSKRPQLRRGQRWESVVAEMLVETLQSQGHDVEIRGANDRYIDKEHPIFACEIDYELNLNGEHVQCELKTVHPFKAREWGEDGGDGVPTHYVAQAVWGLGITGRGTCIVAALFGADFIRTYPISRDDALIAAMRARALAFWDQYVLPGVAPDAGTLNDLSLMWPGETDAPALVADEELMETWLRLRAIDKEMTARTAEYEHLEFKVKRAMKDCAELIQLADGERKVLATWKTRANSHLDQGALKELYPKIHKELTRKGSSRVFTVK